MKTARAPGPAFHPTIRPPAPATMPISCEDRRAINRRNAASSTGPKTPEGKARARANAVKHGLRAETLALACEDPAEVAARAEVWNDYYRPASPAAQHLV